MFGLEGVSRVDVGLGAGATTDAVAAELERRLTAKRYVLSTPADLAGTIRASTIDFQATSALIAALALFGGAFLIFNTLSMTVAERAREVGLLRAAGATRRQVNGLVLVQALVIGVAGALLGLILGSGLAAAVAWYLRSARIVPIDGPVLGPSSVALALGVGILITLAAAIEPADRAGRIPPIEALRPAGVGRTARARLRWVGASLPRDRSRGRAALWPSTTGGAGVVRWLAVYGILLAATLLTPLLLGPLGAIAAIPFRLVAPGSTRLTRGTLIRDRSRTTLTVGALTVGLAMIVALGGWADDARRAATAWIAGVVPGEIIASSIRPVGVDEPVQTDLAAAPGCRPGQPAGDIRGGVPGHPARRGGGLRRRPAGLWPADGGRRRADGSAQRARYREARSSCRPVRRAAGLRVGDALAFPGAGLRRGRAG